METKTFSFQRYIQLFKTQLGETWKRHLIVTLVFVLLMTLGFAFQNFFLGILEFDEPNVNDEINLFVEGVRAIFGTFIPLSILVLMLIYHAAHSMPFISTKTRSLSYIFLPSTIAEKFCVALTFIFVITFIEWCAVFFLSDIIQYIMGGEMMVLSSFMRVDLILGMSTFFDSSSAFYDSYSSEDIAILKRVFRFEPYTIYTMILTPLVYVSAYFVGANFFRKHPFLLTTLVIWGISSVVNLFEFGFIAAFGGVETYLNPFIFLSAGYLTYYYISNILLMIGLFTLSYYRMKRLSL